jgi:large conductance mechanosensitive channel
VSGFKAFLLKTNAMALAIAVIIGLALNNVVNSIVNDIIMPPIGLALGNIDFSRLQIVLRDSVDLNKVVAIRYGLFLNTVISFVIIAFVVYIISLIMLRPAPASPEPPTKVCPFCKETVPEAATKCRACTSVI